MRRWSFKKNGNNEEFDSFRLMTDILVYLNNMKEITAKSVSNPETLKFYIQHQTDKIIASIEEGDGSNG